MMRNACACKAAFNASGMHWCIASIRRDYEMVLLRINIYLIICRGIRISVGLRDQSDSVQIESEYAFDYE